MVLAAWRIFLASSWEYFSARKIRAVRNGFWEYLGQDLERRIPMTVLESLKVEETEMEKETEKEMEMEKEIEAREAMEAMEAMEEMEAMEAMEEMEEVEMVVTIKSLARKLW